MPKGIRNYTICVNAFQNTVKFNSQRQLYVLKFNVGVILIFLRGTDGQFAQFWYTFCLSVVFSSVLTFNSRRRFCDKYFSQNHKSIVNS